MRKRFRSNGYPIIILMAGLLTVFGCRLDGSEGKGSIHFDAEVALDRVHEWEIENPGVIPNPRFAGLLSDGSLIIIDNSLHTINHFDPDGELIAHFGGVGNGPGEFAQITHAAVNPDGRVAVADLSNARITVTDVYEGSHTFSDFSPGWNTQLSWTDSGLIVLGHPFGKMGTDPGDIFFWMLDPETGEMDDLYQLDLEMQDPPYEQISCTFCAFKFQNDGAFFTTPQDTSYRAFRVNMATGEQTLFTRPESEPVALTEKEKEQSAERMAESARITGMELPDRDIPTYKRRFIDYFPDHEGRLWILMNVAEGETHRFDLFSSEAEFIGSVPLPEDAVAGMPIPGPGNRLMLYHESEDPDVWKAAIYQILE